MIDLKHIQKTNAGLARLSGQKFSFEADMKRQVKEALDKAGIEIPFPTQTLIQVSE